MKPHQQGSAAPRIILALGVAAAIVIAAVAYSIHYVAVKVPVDLAHGAKEEAFDSADRMAKGFKSVFNFTPQITVNGTTVVEQANPVMELATVQQGVIVHYEWSQARMGSTKSMELQGIYQAKAGFNLHDPFKIAMDGGRITATLPAPRLLSLEMTSYKVLKDEDGWWNSINSTDRENAVKAMQEQAKSKAAGSGILEEAKLKFRKQLEDAMKAQNITTPVETSFQNEAPVTIYPAGK